jgi:hypothetical protein
VATVHARMTETLRTLSLLKAGATMIAASKQKGMWMGGTVALGYDVRDHRLLVNAVPRQHKLDRMG